LYLKLHTIIQHPKQAAIIKLFNIASFYDAAIQSSVPWREWPQWLTKKIETTLVSLNNRNGNDTIESPKDNLHSTLQIEDKNVEEESDNEVDDSTIGYTLFS
jgi:hypothetical protein